MCLIHACCLLGSGPGARAETVGPAFWGLVLKEAVFSGREGEGRTSMATALRSPLVAVRGWEQELAMHSGQLGAFVRGGESIG